MVASLELSPADLDALATGTAAAETLRVLVAGQASKRRLLLLALHRSAAERTAGDARASDVDEGFALLRAVDARAPDVTGELLARPLTNAWATRCLSSADPVDLGFVCAVAAAAAIRAGLDFEIRVPAPGGEVFLPGLGVARALGAEHAVVRGKAERVEVVGTEATVAVGSADRFHPSHVIAVEPEWTVEVEDLDPYRDCFSYRPCAYLAGDEVAGLAELMATAWRLIIRDHPDHAAVMRRTLRAIVPLAPDDSGAAISASSQVAYGSVAIRIPPDPATLALLLIHEVRHMTLSAVLDLVDLCVPAGVARHHAPWRLDPRPVQALLQGSYAHLGVTDFWRVHRRQCDAGTDAEFEFAYWRELTTRAVDTLSTSGELTPAGVRFVDGMATTLERWWSEPADPAVVFAAQDMAEADAVMWRLRNHRADADAVRHLSRQFLAGVPCGGIADPVIVPGPPTPARGSGLAGRIRAALRAGDDPQGSEAGTVGDPAYVRGDLAAAIEAYRAMLADDPHAEDAWVGLARALHRRGDQPAAGALTARPELVRDLYSGSRSGTVAVGTPEAFAAWLAVGLAAGGDDAVQGDGGSM